MLQNDESTGRVHILYLYVFLLNKVGLSKSSYSLKIIDQTLTLFLTKVDLLSVTIYHDNMFTTTSTDITDNLPISPKTIMVVALLFTSSVYLQNFLCIFSSGRSLHSFPKRHFGRC